jgi:hypothetical protein
MLTRSVIKLAGAPLAVACVLFALWVAMLAVPGALLIAVIYIMSVPRMIVPACALALAAVLVLLFWWRNWVSGMTMLGGLIAIALLVYVPTVSTSPAKWTAELVQLSFYRGALLRQADELRRRGVSPAVAAVAIDGFGSMTSGIALDPTGEILLKPDERSSQWTATAGKTELGVEDLQARHILGEYYSWFHY